MNHKVFIANRGEIAARIARACTQLNLSYVVVYAENDRDLSYVKNAPEAYSLGEGSLQETYLNQEKLLGVAKECSASLLHPGYGLLSENARFARAVKKEQIIFVGPSADVISSMGDKAKAKALCEKAGVPLIPGFHGEEQDAELLKKKATAMGFPLLIKACAGGGGKGMRLVESPDQFSESLQQAKREAKAAFDDDDVLLEKWIASPRHIEIQVIADAQGQVFSLGERECSLQRRYQKIIEEAPSPVVGQELREEMGEVAIKLCQKIGYQNAATVEFILDGEQNFYFLEMNTRLQVEHPVTEMVSGVDLVALQLKVALGEKLNLDQKALSRPRGHSIECRIYAEDPWDHYYPQTGQVRSVGKAYHQDTRLESALMAPYHVSVDYDPMLAKIVVWGENRTQATEKMQRELFSIGFSGMKTNHSQLSAILRSEFFKRANFHTKTLDQDPQAIFDVISSAQLIQLVFRLWSEQSAKNWDLGELAEEQPLRGVDVLSKQEGPSHLKAELKLPTGEMLWLDACLSTFPKPGLLIKSSHGQDILLYPKTFKGESQEISGSSVVSPMPAKIARIYVEAGESVAAGAPLFLIEAMKMEHAINATFAFVVEEVMCEVSDQVDSGQVLLKVGPVEGAEKKQKEGS